MLVKKLLNQDNKNDSKKKPTIANPENISTANQMQ